MNTCFHRRYGKNKSSYVSHGLSAFIHLQVLISPGSSWVLLSLGRLRLARGQEACKFETLPPVTTTTTTTFTLPTCPRAVFRKNSAQRPSGSRGEHRSKGGKHPKDLTTCPDCLVIPNVCRNFKIPNVWAPHKSMDQCMPFSKNIKIWRGSIEGLPLGSGCEVSPLCPFEVFSFLLVLDQVGR